MFHSTRPTERLTRPVARRPPEGASRPEVGSRFLRRARARGGALTLLRLRGELPVDVILTPTEIEAVLLALETAMGHEPLSEELYTPRDGLLRQPR